MPESVRQALASRTYFKVILGGSFTELDRLEQLVTVFALAGADALDISADLPVVQATLAVLDRLAPELKARSIPRPMVMVSFPLDEDPHFRKIELNPSACIDCGICVPVCPTQVFGMTALPQAALTVDQPLCYGCGRCVPDCPTDALSLAPFSVKPGLLEALSMVGVDAVEIHSAQADPYLMAHCFEELAPVLEDKYISFCYRPQQFTVAHNHTVLQTLQRYLPRPFMIQIDGQPMSATDHPDSSKPSVEAAWAWLSALPFSTRETLGPDGVAVTLSGGINDHTPQWLNHPMFNALSGSIGGVGMGTFARQWVWPYLEGHHVNDLERAIRQAQRLINGFRHRS